MLEYNEITVGKFIIFQDEPWEVLSAHVFRKQQRKPVNATKLKNLITGRVTEYSFHVSDKAEEADLEAKEINFIYESKGEYWFHEVSDKSKRFSLAVEQIGSGAKFLKVNTIVKAILFNDKIIGVKLPIKMELKVVEAPPSMKGNTAQGGNKVVKVETGASVNTPLFVNEGDTIRINTDTGEYVERV
ncbi:MAG TPA: elongation factor P [Candidatus Paceibacterota bacterium]